ncbi:hypothetical protein [Pedobacter agri]|uniref:hypothetical protein n=1 Tax=Pedobacter agri TaxID=454586 RepID=UPI0029300491|nr:hypothetical protein [Pedobacter agri]
MKLTFNDRSEIEVPGSIQAIGLLNEFFDTCDYLKTKYGRKPEVYFTKSFLELSLHPSLPMDAYLSQLEKDKKSFVLSLITGKPVAHDYPYYLIDSKACNGLGYACENEHPGISLSTEDKWKENFIKIQKVTFDDNDHEVSEEINKENIFDKASSDTHHAVLEKLIKAEKSIDSIGVYSGKEIWAARTELFPKLIFSPETEKYLKSLNGGGMFRALLGRLIEMNAYFEGWAMGDFDSGGFGGESRSEFPSRRAMYNFTFPFPEGKSFDCYLHCNYFDRGSRLHFHANTEDRLCYIGYMGKKIGA